MHLELLHARDLHSAVHARRSQIRHDEKRDPVRRSIHWNGFHDSSWIAGGLAPISGKTVDKRRPEDLLREWLSSDRLHAHTDRIRRLRSCTSSRLDVHRHLLHVPVDSGCCGQPA